jgi:VWFA-related protein
MMSGTVPDTSPTEFPGRACVRTPQHFCWRDWKALSPPIFPFLRRTVLLAAALGVTLVAAQSPFANSPQGQGEAGSESAAAGQDAYGGVVFQGGTERVVLHTTVVDKNDHLVTDLAKDDFKVFEDDAPQEILEFTQEDVPVSLGILVDNSGSMIDRRRKVSTAALDFVKASNPRDEVFIVNFNDEPFLDAPFTKSQERLRDALQRIDSRSGTALYDATSSSLDYLEKEAKLEKKVLLIITDGEDNASRGSLEDLVRRLQETNTIVFAIGLLSEEDRRSAKRAQRAIRHITRATGGASYFPDSAGDVHALTQQIAHAIRNQYVIVYRPDENNQPGFRRVRVALAGKARRYDVRHRPGYYGN